MVHNGVNKHSKTLDDLFSAALVETHPARLAVKRIEGRPSIVRERSVVTILLQPSKGSSCLKSAN